MAQKVAFFAPSHACPPRVSKNAAMSVSIECSASKNRLFLSTFPMFVPSLSWQNDPCFSN